ncbi:hypothetical protein COCON_G00000940 [Conger conger]|uniref:Uncharacterized protein n=1 Tax=Conger conger TaxID=82655 RepID=A0A9Q1E0L5_CONCO|nr:hypothetical protein COCON_G00000940 [Conger conger]
MDRLFKMAALFVQLHRAQEECDFHSGAPPDPVTCCFVCFVCAVSPRNEAAEDTGRPTGAGVPREATPESEAHSQALPERRHTFLRPASSVG